MSSEVEKVEYNVIAAEGDLPQRIMGLRRYLWAISILLALLVVIVTSLSGSGSGAGIPVRLNEVKVGSLTVDVLASGKVEAVDRVEVRYGFDGATVTEVLVEPGERVGKDQPLMQLETEEVVEKVRQKRWEYLQASMLLAELTDLRQRDAEIKKLELTVERLQQGLDFRQALAKQKDELFEKKLVSKNDLLRAKLEVDSAQLAVTEAELDLKVFMEKSQKEELDAVRAEVEYRRVALERAGSELGSATLLAPIGGIVLDLPAQVGTFLRRGDSAVTIADMHHFRVTAVVDELELSNLQPGQTATVRCEYFGADELQGTVKRIVPSVKSHRGVPSAQVLIDVISDEWEPPDGLTVDVSIHIDGAEEAKLVPLEAVVERQGENVVYIYINGRARMRQVTVGLRNEREVEIIEGVRAHELVVTGGHVFLMDGDPIEPAEEGSGGGLKVEFFE
jgi:HlyD family secretion protein